MAFKSEDTVKAIISIIEKLPISAIVLLLIMIIGQKGLINMYKEASPGIDKTILASAFVALLFLFVIVACGMYIFDKKLKATYTNEVNNA